MKKKAFNIGDTVRFRSGNPIYNNLEFCYYYGFVCRFHELIDVSAIILLRPVYLNNTFKNSISFEELVTTRLILFEKANKNFIDEVKTEDKNKKKEKTYDCFHENFPNNRI